MKTNDEIKQSVLKKFKDRKEVAVTMDINSVLDEALSLKDASIEKAIDDLRSFIKSIPFTDRKDKDLILAELDKLKQKFGLKKEVGK